MKSDGRPILEVRDLVKCWKGVDSPVLDGVNLELAPGRLVAVHGDNGAGKTTLLRIVSGLIEPDSGSISVGGHTAEERREFQQRIGFVSAGNGALYARLTVDDHLGLWGRLAMLPRSRRAAASDATLEQFGLDELRGRRVDRLSTGQRQRLRLALGFMHEPELLLLDEPESSLDDRALGLLSEALRGARANGATAIICSPSAQHEHLAIDESYLVTNGKLERT